MKKAFLLMLSLFSALSLMFLSCKTDSSSGGGTPEFDVTICDGNGTEKKDWSVDTGSDLTVYVKSENYFNALEKKSATYINSNNNDIVDLDLEFVQTYEERKLHKYNLTVPRESGSYTVTVVFNRLGNKKQTKIIELNLTVRSSANVEYVVPEISVQPKSKDYEYGTTEFDELTVKASCSDGSLCTYQWFDESGKLTGETKESFKPTKAGKYYVIVYNSNDNKKLKKSEWADVHIKSEGELDRAVFTKNLEESASYDKIGLIKALEVSATGKTGETVHYQWYKNNEKILNAIEPTYKPEDFGSYNVEIWVTNADGKSSGVTFSNTIVISETPIKILNSGSAIPSTASVGDNLSVNASTNVDGKITYQWYIANASSEIDSDIDGATDSTYTLKDSDINKKIGCKVTVTSIATGETAHNSGLFGLCKVTAKDPEVPESPKIKKELIDVTCEPGKSFELKVEVETPANGGTLTYKWSKGSAVLEETSDIYKKDNCSVEDSGEYTVTIINNLNGKTSLPVTSRATVTVTSNIGGVGGVVDFTNN